MTISPPNHPPAVAMLLRLENLAALVAAVLAYQALGGNWWLFAALLFVPDLSMLGYLGGPRRGAIAYNLVHNWLAPALLAGLGAAIGQPLLWQLAAIWAAHIGLDRTLGYGLKYPDGFGVTHLGLIGKAAKDGPNAHTG